MQQTLKELCTFRGIAGAEGAVREYIYHKAAPFAEKFKQDSIGNLLVFKKGTQPGRGVALICAHMDENGFRVQKIREDGTLVIDPVGDISPTSLIGSRVTVGESSIPGVLATEPPLRSSAERNVLPVDQLLLDIGVSDKKIAENMIEIGDPVTFDSEWKELGNRKFKCRALESRIGCAVLLSLLSERLPFDTWFAFTACDTIKANGAVGRGSSLAVARIRPQRILFVECRDAYDFEPVQPADRNLSLGKGCAILIAERGSAYTRSLRKQLVKKAEEQNIRWQYPTTLGRHRPSSRTAVPIAGGALSACLAAPLRYLNTANAVADMDDIESLRDLSRLFISETEEYDD